MPASPRPSSSGTDAEPEGSERTAIPAGVQWTAGLRGLEAALEPDPVALATFSSVRVVGGARPLSGRATADCVVSICSARQQS